MNRNTYIDDNDPCHVYYDMNIINNDQVGDKPPPNLTFNDIRSNPILSDPSHYFCSVIRVTIKWVIYYLCGFLRYKSGTMTQI